MYLIAISVILILILSSLLFGLWSIHSEHMYIANDHVTVRLHYTNYKSIKAVWEAVKKESTGLNVVFEEIDENVAKSYGIYKYPTILKVSRNGRIIEYHGTNDFETLYKFVVSQ